MHDLIDSYSMRTLFFYEFYLYAFDRNKKIDVFQREILKTMVDKIIIGVFDSDNNQDPHKLNFIFKCNVNEKGSFMYYTGSMVLF